MQCINLDKILEWWETDVKFDPLRANEEIIRIPVLHAKYVGQLTAHETALEMKKLKYVTKERLKIEYYAGRMSDNKLKELGWKPFQLKLINRTDVDKYVDSDDEMIELREKMIPNSRAIDLCREILKQLNARTYQLKAYLEHERFIAGQY